MTLRVSLLGPLQVIRGEEIVTPSAGKLRQLLSLLALCANNIVLIEQIIEELWEQCPPASVSTTLQTYIYLLRKDLGLGRPQSTRASGTVDRRPSLQTSPYGYQLCLDTELLDSLRFEQLAERGRLELEAGKTATAAGTLAEALQHWRGPALVDVACGPLLQAEVLRLEENRKSTLENRIDADLALGRHMELLGELTALVAKHPTHEGFPARLMKALYRAGRRSDALGVYQRLRYNLATELGLDPSTEVERLHQSILNADSVLDLPEPAESSTVLPVTSTPPSQIPHAVPEIVGRSQQLAEIFDLLTAPAPERPTVVMIAGPPGVGATTICAHVSHQVRGCYPGGQFFAAMIDQDGRRVGAAKVLENFLKAIGVPEDRMPPSLMERAQVFQDWARTRKILIVLDDVVDTCQVSPLLPVNPDSALLVTCRRRLSIPSVSTLVNIPPLTVDEGVRLLMDLLGKNRVERELAAARRLVDLYDGLPAALQGIAACLLVRPHWTLERLAARKDYELSVSGAVAPERSDDPAGSILASVQRTYQLAPRRSQIALGQLAKLSASVVSLSVAASALGVDEHLAESILEELVELRLLETEAVAHQEKGPHYWFLPTFRRMGTHLAGFRHRLHWTEGGFPATTGAEALAGAQGLPRVS
ncbi:DNA-binding SARP family transcriptional activator [Nonomuraea polychroma]|uniref:DNA-binding SARP family transcriptional activator n=1 Tax=Nonomuraea polychroma TaxID=46176 RepID=A0A438MF29_9ACTN|nr:BTAD domain-containing putative transcriptional regulator [Nonomuraea polychroma]RVX44135.1 DNA-binding SARP family transcriptional activator [Nonomuraea polychroma]